MIFISYKSEEESIMMDVRKQLTCYGYTCWSAVPNILGGRNYQDDIPGAIEKADAFLLLLSEKAQTSEWIPDEISKAINERKTVIAINIDGCKLKRDFDFVFQRRQIIQGKNRMQAAVSELVDSLKAKGIAPDQKKQIDRSSAPGLTEVQEMRIRNTIYKKASLLLVILIVVVVLFHMLSANLSDSSKTNHETSPIGAVIDGMDD